MKIVYFYQYFGTPKGGWSTRVYEMTRRWVEWGADVTVITSLYDKSDLTASGFLSKHEIEGVKVYVTNVKLSNKHNIIRRVYSFLFFALVSSWYALTMKYDVVIASSGPITIGVPGLIGRYLRRKRFFFEVRDLWPEGAVSMGMLNNKLLQKLAWWFEGLCYKASEGVIALSPGMKESIVRRYPKTRTYVMPNASDVELFNNPKYQVELPDWAQGKKLFLYTGTLGKMDDCSQILKGAKVIHDQGRKDIIIVFLGDGNEKQHLQEMAKEMGLTNVHFIGMRPKEQVVGWLKHAVATFVVFKNIRVWDTCSPNKMFDAFAAGVPLIQTTQGWIKELFAKENCGINVDPESPQEMADAITALADNAELRSAKAANARRLGEQFFNRTKIAREMLDVITSSK